MAIASPPPTVSAFSDGLPRKRWTREECRRLTEMGLLEPGNYELIEGDIVEKVGQNEPHVVAIKRVFFALVQIFGLDFVRMPAPVAISDTSEPEPDASVTLQSDSYYLEHGTPAPADIRLAVEVSDTTLRYDRTGKALLYARSGVPEYWVLDLNGRQLIVHTNPGPNGYASVTTYGEADTVIPTTAPSNAAPIAVAGLLP